MRLRMGLMLTYPIIAVSTPLERKDNVYITKLHLPNGVHKIKFVVDGDWKVTDHYEIMREEGKPTIIPTDSR
jgi:Glycogen recognition site of AMP-activated protein kinase